MHEPEDRRQPTAELADFIRVVRERAWIITLAVVIVVGASLLLSLRSTPLYQASSKIVYQTNNLDSALFGAQVFADDNQERILETGAELVRLPQVAMAVKQQLGSPRSPLELIGMIDVTASVSTNIIQINAVSVDPGEAADVANAFAEQFIVLRRDTDREIVAAARELVKAELDSLSTEDANSSYGLMLKEKYESLRILEAMQNGGFTLVETAIAPGLPFSPRLLRNGLVGLVLGLAIGLVLAFLLNYLDRRLKDVKALESAFGLPVLADVPVVGGRWKRRRRSRSPVGFVTHPVLLESFRALRSSLQYFNLGKSIKIIVVTSGLPQEGKTVTTVNLALSLVLAGNRVVIVEADMRRPMVPSYLGLDNQAGLSTVLAGSTTLGEALQLVDLDSFFPQDVIQKATRVDGIPIQRSLGCLSSGPLPPNPAELLSSDRMDKLLEELRLNPGVDYVIVDTPPVLSVADGLVLAPKADAVVLATRVNWTTRDEAEEVSTQLRRSGARAIGVVAGGVRVRSGYYGRRGYYRYDTR